MPVITIKGLTNLIFHLESHGGYPNPFPRFNQENYEELQKFGKALQGVVAKTLKLKKPQGVSIDSPLDLFFSNQKQDFDSPIEEIIISVEVLFDMPERTQAVRQKLAETIVECVHKRFKNAELIECFVHPFKKEQGLASYKKK